LTDHLVNRPLDLSQGLVKFSRRLGRPEMVFVWPNGFPSG